MPLCKVRRLVMVANRYTKSMGKFKIRFEELVMAFSSSFSYILVFVVENSHICCSSLVCIGCLLKKNQIVYFKF
ncbi:hypothetical protein ES332_D05G283900v1 [Gossypium tomentosum]|uniref:Uncharacterized protein n=1 Tax=Gossypium tomentosum TaxID=34277 RepID=A0A5D2L0S0_GOSTO|nr:hypothetical protein ES332_D05G283900v1 [Gossypium tomentosum]